MVQGRHLSVQGGGYNPFLGPEQWRPAQSHPEQQWVWAGSSPGDLHVSSQERGPSRNIYFFSCLEHPPRSAVAETVPVSRSTSGTDCWPTILTTTVPVSSWTGSSSPPAVSAGQLVTFFYSIYTFILSGTSGVLTTLSLENENSGWSIEKLYLRVIQFEIEIKSISWISGEIKLRQPPMRWRRYLMSYRHIAPHTPRHLKTVITLSLPLSDRPWWLLLDIYCYKIKIKNRVVFFTVCCIQ